MCVYFEGFRIDFGSFFGGFWVGQPHIPVVDPKILLLVESPSSRGSLHNFLTLRRLPHFHRVIVSFYV